MAGRANGADYFIAARTESRIFRWAESNGSFKNAPAAALCPPPSNCSASWLQSTPAAWLRKLILKPPLCDTLLTHDYYMHLADLKSYVEADSRLLDLYSTPTAWTRKAILNVAASGKFSSDRTISEYAADIWNVVPCPVQ